MPKGGISSSAALKRATDAANNPSVAPAHGDVECGGATRFGDDPDKSTSTDKKKAAIGPSDEVFLDTNRRGTKAAKDRLLKLALALDEVERRAEGARKETQRGEEIRSAKQVSDIDSSRPWSL